VDVRLEVAVNAPEHDRLDHADPHEQRMGPAARYRTFRRGLRGNSVLDLTWRIGVLTVGGMVVAAGLAMLALPGPGWATIFIGLMILASEFAWARRSLDWTRAKAHSARMRASAPEVRRRNVAAVAVAGVVLLVGTAWYWQTYSFPGPVGAWLMEIWQT
jgi:uncharacterized protein (TIGR02611 family)